MWCESILAIYIFTTRAYGESLLLNAVLLGLRFGETISVLMSAGTLTVPVPELIPSGALPVVLIVTNQQNRPMTIDETFIVTTRIAIGYFQFSFAVVKPIV